MIPQNIKSQAIVTLQQVQGIKAIIDYRFFSVVTRSALSAFANVSVIGFCQETDTIFFNIFININSIESGIAASDGKLYQIFKTINNSFSTKIAVIGF